MNNKSAQMDKNEVVDTLKAAQLYLSHLKSLDNELESAVKQIINTYEETEKNIRDTFSNLKGAILNILNKREQFLLNHATRTKKEGLEPLEECRTVISNNVETTNKLINLGNSIINGVADGLVTFSREASLLGSLPEVPELKLVPFISFHVDNSHEDELKNILNQFGEVYRIAPIQITELTEKPGAILVEWQSIENEDKITDIQEFKLQRAFGDVTKEKHLMVNFSDCYRGLETQFLVKDLKVLQPYSFRVCCKFEGISEWSPWSLPQVACTSLRPFSWGVEEDYIFSNENKIAKSTANVPTTLYSDGPQFGVGNSVEFTFLESSPSDAIVGLIDQKFPPHTNLVSSPAKTFLVVKCGKIYVDGTQKSTILSAITKGLKISFTCECAGDDKMRVNVDCNEKRVTYDWPVDPTSKLYFVCQLFNSSTKCTIMVE